MLKLSVLKEYLLLKEFRCVEVGNNENFVILFQQKSCCINVLLLIEQKKECLLTRNDVERISENIRNMFLKQFQCDIHIMTIVLADTIMQAEAILQGNESGWIILKRSYRLVIPKDEKDDYYGLKAVIEDALSQIRNSYQEKEYNIALPKKIQLGVCKMIVVVNVLCFIVCTFFCPSLYNTGSLFVPAIIYHKEYERFLCSMFLHADVQHLFSNMILLYFVGEIVEKHLGHIAFGVMYFFTGILGGIVSCTYDIYMGSFHSSVGASGAVFGVLGSLLCLVVINKGKLEQLSLKKVMIAILLSLYSGFVTPHINNAAHIGGFIGGIIFVLLVLLWEKTVVKFKK